jgi:hypothetical protein
MLDNAHPVNTGPLGEPGWPAVVGAAGGVPGYERRQFVQLRCPPALVDAAAGDFGSWAVRDARA